MTYLEKKVEEITEEIANLQYELCLTKAFVFLETLEATSYNVYVDYLAEHYKTASVKSFPHNEFTEALSFTRMLSKVKAGISRFKSQTDTKKNPTWAKEAMKAAKIIDNYYNSKS